MDNKNSFFVKLICKDINNMKSLIINREKYLKKSNNEKTYIMCAGKYDKNGWNFVARTNSYEEAEKLASINPFEYIKYKIN